MTRTTKVTCVPPARALFNNGSVLIFGLPTKNNACAVKTGLTTENRSDKSRNLDCCDFKEMTRFLQSLSFCSFLEELREALLAGRFSCNTQCYLFCMNLIQTFCNQEVLQEPLVKDIRTAGSVSRSSEMADTVKEWFRQVGPSTTQLVSVTTLSSFGGIYM